MLYAILAYHVEAAVKSWTAEEDATVMTNMIEPVMIICMGGVVGFIAMAVILPIFKMSQVVK